jgi:ribosome-binding ATPase YchF (GTP1/OBG family)
MRDLGIETPGLDEVINMCYKMLSLITFFTMNEKEVHARTIQKGTTAKEAAGKVHTDFERGFISAEAINFVDLDKIGSLKEARTKGLVRLEGKNYVAKDGDILHFRFSV